MSLAIGKALLDATGLEGAGWDIKSLSPTKIAKSGGIHSDLGFSCPATKIIGISSKLLKHGCERNILDTVLHEIAHAITDTIHGPGLPAHGDHWKDIAAKLGAVPDDYGYDCECCEGL